MIWASCFLFVVGMVATHEAGALKQQGLRSVGAATGAVGAVALCAAVLLYGAYIMGETRSDCEAEVRLTSAVNSDK